MLLRSPLSSAMRTTWRSGAPQKPAPRRSIKPQCSKVNRQRMPLALRQPRRVISERCVRVKSIAVITESDVVRGSACVPRTMPTIAIRKNDILVASAESINSPAALVRLRQRCATPVSHNSARSTLSGKANRAISTPFTMVSIVTNAMAIMLIISHLCLHTFMLLRLCPEIL